MTLDTLPILSDLELKQIHDGKIYRVAEMAEIEATNRNFSINKDEKGYSKLKLVYVIGKTKHRRIVFSTEGIKEGRKRFTGKMCRFDDESEAGADISIWHIHDIKTYKPLQYKK